MKKTPSPSKEMLKDIILTGVVAGLSFTLLLLAILPFVGGKQFRNIFPTFNSVSDESEAATPSPFTVSVSKDGSQYSSNILIPVGGQYWLKTNPPYTGYLEAKLVGSKGPSKWNATNSSGIAKVTSTQLSGIVPGSYMASFRPWVSSGTNPYAWSNQVNVFIKSSATQPKVSVSKDGITYSNEIEINVGDPYYLKMDPPVFGYYESKMKDSAIWNKWNFATSSGIATATKEQMAKVPAGTYIASFRPWTGAISNPYIASKEVIVVVNSSTSTARKSTTLACTGAAQPNVSKMLNVGTWNIGGNNGQNNATGDALLDAKATAVGQKFKEFNLDVMIVQEVHPFRATPFSESITKTNFNNRVKAASGMNNLYFYPVYQEGSNHSLVTISKYPIEQSGNKRIDGSRNISYALINSPAGKVKVINLHLQRKDDGVCPGMSDSINNIRTMIAPGDVYLVGVDFNAEFDSRRGFSPVENCFCNSAEAFPEVFPMYCLTSMCKYTTGTSSGGSGDVIDFIIAGTSKTNASVY
ncbi:MAG: hypothetical protein QG570_708, partial [Patescibacteria group bacterium]|nr:hypothetical protein [Patescibacteria group bacterium]